MVDTIAGDDNDPSFIPQEYLAEIGRVANAWGHLDFSIDHATWTLLQVPHEFAACLTAQIFSTQGKLKAFIALAGVRGISEGLMSELRTLNGKTISGLQEKRNRIVHDTRMIHDASGVVNRLQITAQSSLTFGMQEEPLSKVRETRRKIEALIGDWHALRDRILAELPELIEMPVRDYVQIDLIPKDEA